MQQLQDQQQTYTIVERILMQIFFQNFWLPRHPKHWFITFWEIELTAYETHVFKLNNCLSHILHDFYTPQMFWLAMDTGESLLDIPECGYKGITHWYTNFTNHCLCYTDDLIGVGYKRITQQAPMTPTRLFSTHKWSYMDRHSNHHRWSNVYTRELLIAIPTNRLMWHTHGSYDLTMDARTNSMGKTIWDSSLCYVPKLPSKRSSCNQSRQWQGTSNMD